MNACQTTMQALDGEKFASDLATRLRITLTIGAMVIAACITALAAWSSWHHTRTQESAAQRAWDDLERQRIEWKLGQSLAIAGSVSDSLATLRDDAASLAIAQKLLDSRHIGLEGAALTVIDARGATLADSAGKRQDLRNNPAVLDMLSNRRVAAEAHRDASGQKTALLIAHPISALDDGRILGGVVLHLPQATLLAGGSLNGSNAALLTREQSIGHGPVFAKSRTFQLHLGSPLDQLGLRLEIAARAVPHAWPALLVVAIWSIAGILLGLLLVALARRTSNFILATRRRATAREEFMDGSGLLAQQANVP